jgi:aspartate/methionine/tyrosine aminotransferase
VKATVERMVAGVEPDKRFVYYLMGATGIVVVPLTGFQCAHHGFRGTLLESNDAKRAWILETLRETIDAYVASGANTPAMGEIPAVAATAVGGR